MRGVGQGSFKFVVKSSSDDAFVITAYLTGQLKAGGIIWPTR